MLEVIPAKLGVERLVLLGDLLSWGRVPMGRTDRAAVIAGGVDAGGQRGKVSRAVAEFVLDGKGRESAEAASSFISLLKALCQQASLERESVEG